MDEIKRYEVVYTETAVRDMEQKADYITWHFGAPDLAETWYFRLRADIQEGLSTFPYHRSSTSVIPLMVTSSPHNACKVPIHIVRAKSKQLVPICNLKPESKKDSLL